MTPAPPLSPEPAPQRGQRNNSSGRLDALFQQRSGGQPAPGHGRPILVALVVAVPLALSGVFCVTGVLGLLLALWGLRRCDQALSREDNLPLQQTLWLSRTRQVARLTLWLSGLSLTIQFMLLAGGYYQAWLGRLDMWLAG